MASSVLVGCDVPIPAHNLGVPVPDARIEVVLPEPTDRYELYVRFKDVAEISGFLRPLQERLDEHDFEVEFPKRSFQWNSTAESANYPQAISFMFPRGVERPDRFTFVYRRGSTEGFEEREWLMFMNWRDRILPHFFEKAEFRVTRHPAVFTNFKIIESISRATHEPIPERVRAEYTEWLSKNTEP